MKKGGGMATMLGRRDFMAGSAAVSAALLGGIGCRSAGYVPPDRIRVGRPVVGRPVNIACVGCGGKGADDIRGIAHENIVALCDVDPSRAASTFQAYPAVRKFTDYRTMLAEMDDQIDAVTVSIPDHMHYPVALLAIQMGKHVYVQKPLTHTIAEARRLREAARVHRVMAQMGNQGHCNEGTRLCREWIEAGVIGEVRRVDIWTNRPIWPQNRPLPAGTPPVPDGLDWNAWQGVAPWRDYHPDFLPFHWRGWWDYGCGAIGDMGCHTMDAAFWALDLAAPTFVEPLRIEGGNAFSGPAGAVVAFHFPARGKLPPLVMTWFEGVCGPPMPDTLEPGRNLGNSGQLFYGSKGILHGVGDYCDSVRLVPETAMKAFTDRPPKVLPRIVKANPYRNWLDAVHGTIDRPASNFDHAAPLTELGQLGNLAIRSGKAFSWDAARMRASAPEAQAFTDKTYRMF